MLAQIENTCTTYLTATVNLYFIDERAVHREDTLYAYAIGNFANGESFFHPAVSALNYIALKLLNTLFVSFFDFIVNRNAVTGFEIRNIVAQILARDGFNNRIHVLKNWGAKISKCLCFSNRSLPFSTKSCFLVITLHICSPIRMRKLRLQELNRLSTEDFRQASKLPMVVVLDNIRSMHNVGSFFRTTDAFRCEKLVLCGITAQPPHRDITKTALGADRSVLWEYFADTQAAVFELKKQGYFIIGVEQTTQSVPLQDFSMPEKPIAVIFGNEIDGLQSEVLELCNVCIEIPQAGTKHSLNVSVAAGIVLWHFCAPHLSSLP